MSVLNSLKKQELLNLAKQKNIAVNTKMTKATIIKLLLENDTKISEKTNHKTNTKKKSSVPTKNIKSMFNKNITVLMQSNQKSLIIWNADPTEDHIIKAWKVQNDMGLDILLPSYSRSIFIDNNVLKSISISIFKIYQDNSKEFHQKYTQPIQNKTTSPIQEAMFAPYSVSNNILQPYIDEHLTRYKNTASENHFDNRHLSSEQYFISKNKEK